MSYLDRITGISEITRRNFVKAGTLAMTAMAVTGVAGCSPKVETGEVQQPKKSEEPDIISGEWIPAACWHNCGGRCANKVLVREGMAIRQKTDDSHEDSYDHFQQRSCVRGRAQRMQCFAADRLKYPMKRKNWSPEAPHGELRGKDEWERITWDEAFEYIAAELKKAYENYGPSSILAQSYTMMATGGSVIRVLDTLGGHTVALDTWSMGTYCQNCALLGLPPSNRIMALNDRFDILNADYIVMHAANPAWTQAGSVSWLMSEAKHKGVKFIAIDPMYSASAAVFDARWIKVRPGSDTVFMLAVAYEMLKLDEARGDIIDWDFLHTYCVGFDAESMPANGQTGENFKAYLLGEYDGIPKTAEWATEICGTPVEEIRWYAEVMGKNNAVSILHGYAHARCMDAEDVPQLGMTLAAMGGHFGKPGHSYGGAGDEGYFSGPALIKKGSGGMPPIKNAVDDAILGPIFWKSILDKKYPFITGYFSATEPAQERNIDIRVIYQGQGSRLNNTPDVMLGIKAYRSVDFAFAAAQFCNTHAKYSDIVLPVTTEWERPGSLISSNRETLFVYTKVTDPLYEAKTDQEIGYGIAEAMGLNADEIYPLSETQQFMNSLLGTTIMEPSGEMVPLLTITDDDLKAWGCEGTAQTGKVDLATFLKDGIYQMDLSANDTYRYIAYESFVKDPAGNPLKSASGKFEIYCQEKANTFHRFGFSDDFKPYPSYRKPTESYENTFKDFDKKIKGDYPYLIYTPHYYRSSHSSLDNIPWLREAWSHPIFISAADAKEKGIKTGDDVAVWTEFGKIVRKASVLENLMPGVLANPHGAWVDLNETEEYDMGGNDSVLVGTRISGMGVSGYNNRVCNFEKFKGDVQPADCERPQRIIEF